MAPVWDPLGYGYINLEDSVTVGDVAALLDLHGLLGLRVMFTGPGLPWLALSAPGWKVTEDRSAVTADYFYPQGLYEDAQKALDCLVVSCTERGVEKGEMVSAQVWATLRSGAEKSLGSCSVRWSSVISWAAFGGYGFTWREVENRALTWLGLESLPLPKQEVSG